MDAFQRRFVLFFVTGAGAGFSPWFPGTVGTLVAIPLSLGLNALAVASLPLSLITLAAFIACALWFSTEAEKIMQQKDPGTIVIDEISGFMVANYLAPQALAPLVLAFVLFRLFDIVKIFPASRLERLPGGLGVILDDLVAGLYVFVILRLVLFWELL